MKIKFYARQVNPEFQEDDLFYTFTNKQGRTELGFNDEIYDNNIIIEGNDDYLTYSIREYDNLMKLDSLWYEYETLLNPKSNHCYWSSFSEFFNYYLPKSNGKKYSNKEIHQWKELMKKNTNEIIEDALKLMTGKSWRKFKMTGYCQRDWQYGYASEEITDKQLEYVGMCYFNTGNEYIVFESREDFKKDENGYSMYVDSWQSKEYMADLLACKPQEISMYDWDGYSKTPKYKHI